MRLATLLLLACLPSAAFTAEGVLAGESHERGERLAEHSARLKEKHPELFARLDTNADGTISKEEFQAGRQLLKEARAKHDGAEGRVREEVKERFDADHDGKLSEEERTAARAALAARLKEKHPDLLAKIDTNGDGVISQEEMQAGRELLKAAREQRREHRQEGRKGGDKH